MSGKHVRENQSAAGAHLGRQNARPTIGYLVSDTVNAYDAAIQAGLVDGAQERDVNLISFVGGQLHHSPYDQFAYQRNAAYGLATANSVDGLVINSTLGNFVTTEELRDFFAHYRPLPTISIGEMIPDVVSILVDNDKGMREVIVHFIEKHGYRRIAFIRGPKDNNEAERRYRVYTAVLAEYGLPLDPNLIAPGDFLAPSGAEAIRLLLDERKVDVQAVVASNDGMALGALEALQARGVRVPDDVAVVGFDDVKDAKTVTPSLTTVRQPLFEQGKQATEKLLALLAGEQTPKQMTLPTELVVRRSCGCLDPAVVQASAGMITRSGELAEADLATQRERVCSEMTKAIETYGGGINPEWRKHLWEAFTAELTSHSPGVFLLALDDVLRQVATSGGDVAMLQGAVSALRRHTLPYLDGETLLRAEDLWQQARVVIGLAAQQRQAYQNLQAERQTDTLQEIEAALLTTFDMNGLINTLAEGLPRLGIPSCYVSLYENSQEPTEWSRLVLAYNENGRVELEADGQRFRTRQLVPEGLWPRERQCSFVAMPLYFRENQLGFALFETGPRDGTIYEALRGQISSALKGAQLARQAERRALQLQTASEVSSVTSSILDPDELIQQTVDLIHERFGLYYVGLFLVDQTGAWTGEPDKWAVLRAGTGEAGRQMMERGHKLEIGGDSMIGWCVANKQARIALDMGKDAVRFGNLLLPQTRSEMALPLTSRGHVIGAVTIQSTQPAAFTQEDITALQTMADQLANAIDNAHLFDEHRRTVEALAQEQYLMQVFMENTPDHIYFKDRSSRFIRISKAHARLLGLSEPAQAVGKSDFDFFTEEHARPAYEDEQKIIQTGQPLMNVEEKETWPDRPDTWVSTSKLPFRDKDGHIIGTFGISRDITGRKQTEETLAYEQYLLNSLLDNAPYRIYFKDAEGRFIRVNRAWAEQHDLDDPTQAIGKTDFDFVAEKNARSAFADEQTIIKTGQPLMDKEATRTLSDGRQVWSSISKQPLRDKDGQIVGTFGISRDITERKRAEAERERLMADLERRALQLQTAAEVSRAASSILNVDELLPQVVELIRARFDLYYTGLFLVDETGQSPGHPSGVWAILRAGTGEPGRKMLEAGHKLEIDDTSMIGSCVAQGKAGVALDVEKAIRYKNPHLPETRSEMALPLINRGRVIGAMTIQSAQPTAFTQEDIAILQTMADQLANAVQNALLFDESKRARLLLDQRVKGLDCLNDIGRKLEETVPLSNFLQWVAERVPPIMQYPDLCVVAIEYRGQVYGVPEALALPRQMVQGLHIGGEIVGRLCIAYTEEHDFLDEESALLGDIARRVNGYLENQWLFSETQARARREQTLREITARVRSSMDSDTVLRTAIRELGTALGRPSFVRLGSAEQLSKAQSAGGDGKNLTQEGDE